MPPSDAELLADIRAVADQASAPPSLSDYRDHGDHAVETYYNRFGSWTAAVRAAGFRPRQSGDRISTPQLLLELRQLADDEPPTADEMDANGAYSVTTYQNRFGSWNAALAAAGLADRNPHGTSET